MGNKVNNSWKCVFLFFLLALFYSLQFKAHNPQYTVQSYAMTIPYRVMIGQELSPKERSQVRTIIEQVFDEVDSTYNKYNPSSELSKLNQAPANKAIPLSPELLALLQLTDKMVNLTEGRFDPTVEPLQSLWKKYLEEGKTPPQEEIAVLIPAIGWNHLSFENGSFIKDHSKTAIDLGGIAKGLAVDQLLQTLNDAGYQNVYVEWGGEIRCSGEHPEKRPWMIAVKHADGHAPIPLHNQAIATSGDYEQYWTVQGEDNQKVTYYHIIDSKTHRPRIRHSNRIGSTTVIAPTCVIADALATTLMMFDTAEEAEAWVKKVGVEGLNATVIIQ